MKKILLIVLVAIAGCESSEPYALSNVINDYGGASDFRHAAATIAEFKRISSKQLTLFVVQRNIRCVRVVNNSKANILDFSVLEKGGFLLFNEAKLPQTSAIVERIRAFASSGECKID